MSDYDDLDLPTIKDTYCKNHPGLWIHECGCDENKEIKPKIKWVKNNPKKHKFFHDGDKFLVAIKVKNNRTGIEKWEFDVVTMECDGESAYLTHGEGDMYDSWVWTDFEYFHLLEGEIPKAEMGED